MVNIKKQDEIRSVGRRKTASARVKISEGKGQIIVNNKDFKEYFPYFEWQEMVTAPLKATAKEDKLSFVVKVVGGGAKSQARAVQHGIARVLVKYDEELKKIVKAEGYLTRDSRVKERKKPGLKKARRAPQWKKR